MKNFSILILVCTFLLSCKSKSPETQESNAPVSNQPSITTESYEPQQAQTEAYEDGDYCATIEYYNGSTGKSSTYTLEVEVENGELIKINWSSGGWLDSSHFNPPEVDTDGSCSFTTFDGKNYDVQIEGTGGCGYSNSSPDEEDEAQEEEVESEEESTDVGGNDLAYSFLINNLSAVCNAPKKFSGI